MLAAARTGAAGERSVLRTNLASDRRPPRTEGLVTVIPFAMLAAVLALVVHSVQRDYYKALLVTAVCAAVVLQVAFYQQRGYLHKGVLIEMITSGSLATLVAAVVGGPFVYYRRRRERNATGRLR